MMHSTKSKNKLKAEPGWSFEAIGTQWQINLFDIYDKNLKTNVFKLIESFDKHYSRFREDSLIRKIATKSGEYRLPGNAKVLFDFYLELYDITGGLLTPLIGETLEQAGYDATYSLIPGTLSRPKLFHEVVRYNFPYLRVSEPTLLDFGAAGKGYLVDLIGALLMKHEVKSFCINAGGDILSMGKSQMIGLEDPDDATRLLGEVKLHNEALCGSSGNRRAWGDYHHIINPSTLTSPRGIKAIWVKAKTTILADGLSTALFFVDPEILREKYDFEYAMIKEEDIITSSGFGERLYTN